MTQAKLWINLAIHCQGCTIKLNKTFVMLTIMFILYLRRKFFNYKKPRYEKAKTDIRKLRQVAREQRGKGYYFYLPYGSDCPYLVIF